MAVQTAASATMAPVGLPRSSPADLGVAPAGILAFLETIETKLGGLHSFMLLRHGQVAAEGWWTPYEPSRPHVLYSLSKSFTSTAVGLAVEEGHLTVEDKVVSFFPDELPPQVSDNLAAMRVKDLLTMSTGHATEPDPRGQRDWVRAFLAAPVEHKPGTHFLYNTPATHVLSAIVQKLTGQRLTDYLRPRLFEPLNIENPMWEQSPMGIDVGGYGLSLRTEDIARFGQLYLQKGKWNGRQLVPESWVNDATSKQVSNGDPATGGDWNQGYGYQFWRCRHGHYRGDGAFGQFCIVMPNKDAVLAITSGVPNMGAVMEAVWTDLLPAMGDGPANSDRDDELKAKLAGLSVPAPQGIASSPLAAEFSGKTWRFEPNDDQLETIMITFDDDRCTIATTGGPTGQHTLVCGITAWLEGMAPWGPQQRPVATRGTWRDPRSFAIKMCFVETPHEWTQTIQFEPDGHHLTITDRKTNVAFGPTERPPLRAMVVR